MQPAEGTHLLFLDGEGILFSEPAQKLFHLNTSAAFVWYLLEEGDGGRQIKEKLRTTFSLTPSAAGDLLEQTEGLFQSLGVLKGFEEPPRADETLSVPPPERHLYNDERFIAECRYRLLSSNIRMRFTHPEQLSHVEPILEHLRERTPSHVTVAIDLVTDTPGNTVIYRDSVAALTCSEAQRLAPLVKGLVWQTAVSTHEFFLDIHAGVVGDEQFAYLFPAAPGSGKTTLTAALTHHGFEFFSDEVALLHGNQFLVEPVPLAICIKDTGMAVLSRYYPQLTDLKLHLRGDGKRVRYMPPPLEALPPTDTLRPVGAIFFPHYSPHQPTKLEPLKSIEALESLLQECLIVDTRLNKEKVLGMLNWIETIPCYRLTVSDLGEACSLVGAISDKLEQPDLGQY
ncbi:hypothetical protein [Sedimenticola hydrogenitrophicus]|uniref:hypothetical protein n=1 Tax=Sedimenticola hydrogenitrophicus TaxID=2967975 RepID=UPI0021A6EE15|nr:hypothetical protein [Sedimenticola hydrogenitrophicus]